MKADDALRELVEAVRAEHAPDSRTAVFEIETERRGSTVVLSGRSTEDAAVEELSALLRAMEGVRRVRDLVVRLPDRDVGQLDAALVRVSIAPIYPAPRLASGQVSQYVLGQPLDLLARDGRWFRVRGRDRYIGWVHGGYLERGESARVRGWGSGQLGEPAVSLGAELADEEGRVFARLPWGGRVLGDTPGRYRLPDGRSGLLESGEVVAADRLADRFPARGESLARTARRWMGTPYLWGGVTPAGADCSGFVQAVFRMHGVELPRDSDQQATEGQPVEPGADFGELRAADLLFFADRPGRISHVAISLGGSHILHCSLSNGCVDGNDLSGDGDLERELRLILAGCRRLLPDG